MDQKKFLITVDTEGDNLWNWCPGQEITTENAAYIPRFQELCEKYGFKPVYLTNYEMTLDDQWVKYASQKAREGKCEIGMHLHGWNTPPEYDLEDRFGGKPYITEYPAEVMDAKVKTVMHQLQDRFEVPVVSHRSGRWATNEQYFEILVQNGIRVDCSVTPGLDLSGNPGHSQNCGNDYRKARKGIYEIYPGLIEVPMTTRRMRHMCCGSWKHRIKTVLLGGPLWLRPIRGNAAMLEKLTRIADREDGYLEFMIHSSELMPGGSIYFKDAQDIENLYTMVDAYFYSVSQMGYVGATLSEFAKEQEAL